MVVPEQSLALRQAVATALARVGPRPRLLLLGNYGQGNVGDEAILAGLLEDLTPLSDVTVVSREPERVTEMHGVKAVATGSRNAVKAFFTTDVFAIGGGGIFGNGMTLLPKLLPFAALGARLLGKQTGFLAIGAYRTMPKFVYHGLRMVARTSLFVTVRDPESHRVLDVGLAHPVLVPDPAINLMPASREKSVALLLNAGADPSLPLLGISLKPTVYPELDRRQITAAVAACDWWTNTRRGQVIMLCFSERGNNGLGTSTSDAALSAQVHDRAADPASIRIFGPHVDPRDMKGVLSLLECIIAHRLHAQIFAWSLGLPTLGLSYENKSDQFLNGAEIVRLDVRTLNPSMAVSWLQQQSRARG